MLKQIRGLIFVFFSDLKVSHQSKNRINSWKFSCYDYLNNTVLKQKFKEDCPKSIAVPENICAVGKKIKQDHHMTYGEIEASLAIRMTIVYKILHEYLTQKRVCTTS